MAADSAIQICEQDGSLIPNAPTGKYIAFLALDGTWKKKDDAGVITEMYDVDTDLNNKVSVSAGDTTNGFLDAKIIGTSGKIVLSIVNGGGDEDYQINIGADVFDKVVDDTDDITEGVAKFVTAGDLTNLGNLSGTNSGDVTLNAGATTQDSANLASQELELVAATDTNAGILTDVAQNIGGVKTFKEDKIIIDSPDVDAVDSLELGWFENGAIKSYGIRTTGVGGTITLMNNATNPQILFGLENNTTGSTFLDSDNNRPMNINVLDTGPGTQGIVNVGLGGLTVANTLSLTAVTANDNLTLIKSNSTTSWAINAGRSAFFDNWLLFKNSAEASNYTLGLTNSGAIRGKNGSAGAPTYGFGNGSNYGMSLNAGNDGTVISAAGFPLLTVFGTATKRTEIRQDSMFRVGRMSTTTRDGLTPLNGDIIYNTTTSKHQGYNGTIWNDFY